MPDTPEVSIVPKSKESDVVAGYAGYLDEPDVHDAAPITAPMLRWRHQGASSLERQGGKFYNSLEGNERAYDEVEAVFINGKNSRAYYKDAYDARKVKTEGATAPDCKSNDAVLGNGLYGPGSEGNPSGKCETCPMSKWRGKTPPPCALSYDRLIYDFHTNQVGVISFGRTKIAAIRDFQRALQARNGGTVPMWGYKTRMFSEARENYFVPKIEIIGPMPPEQALKFRELKRESDQAFLRSSAADAEADVESTTPADTSDLRTTADAY